jgi:hypothetical protein
LNTAYTAYSVAEVDEGNLATNKREDDRRAGQKNVAFPDRRFSDRRGRQVRKVA